MTYTSTAAVEAKDNLGKTPLHYATESTSKGTLGLLITHEANIQAVDGNGRTPMHHAAQCGSDEALIVLCKNGADINTVSSSGETVLHSFLNNLDGFTPGSDEEKEVILAVSRLLLGSGANPILRDEHGCTPLDMLSEWNKDAAPEIVALLEGAMTEWVNTHEQPFEQHEREQSKTGNNASQREVAATEPSL